jgi:23S rRNA pseudouridine955/2504/2580 synthase/23S rRNA pseudouridine1911/1915/1917 synthase
MSIFIVEKVSPKKPINFLKCALNTSISNRGIKRAIERGCLKVNGRIERFASVTLKEKDVLELALDWDIVSEHKREEGLALLYEDDYFCIVDKKPGFLCEDINLKMIFPNFMLVHRLDKETSGVLILAKSKEAKEAMVELFSTKKVKKQYIALVDGCVENDRGKIENFLQRKSFYEGQTIWGSGDEGAYALTYFKRLSKNRYLSKLLCDIPTGRTHQIRVHLAEMGHPVLGDYQYCRSFKFPHHVNRLMLHSLMVEFIHPFSNVLVSVMANVPKEFDEMIDKCQSKKSAV